MAERGLKALENWAKRVTSGYNGVNVRDMSSSFRDGLAFCAIIHHYFPELIEFESLSKENILFNNSLAFNTAEKMLGVPALLDAKDMVTYSVPDRLSVITYLSQLHNCFENQNKLNRLKPVVKRVLKEGQSGPPSKVPFSEQKNASRAHELCQVCKHRVFILERLMVSGKLYHRTCFRCSKCNSLLKPGAYVEGDSPGSYECAVCPHDEKSDQDSEQSEETSKSSLSLDVTPKSIENSPSISPAISPKLPLFSSTLSSARNSFLQSSIRSEGSYELDANVSASGNSSLSELSSMSVEAATEETQPFSVDKEKQLKSNESNGTVPMTKSEKIMNYSILSNEPTTPEKDSKRKPYQSVFTREIASLKPLVINRTEKKASNLSYNSQYSITPVQTPDSPRLSSRDIPLIRPSAYLKPMSLSRPNSVNFKRTDSSDLEKGHVEQNHENVPDFRRRSLDASHDHSEHSSSKKSARSNSFSSQELSINELKSTGKHSVLALISTFESNENSAKISVKPFNKVEKSNEHKFEASDKTVLPVPKTRFSKMPTSNEALNDNSDLTPDSVNSSNLTPGFDSKSNTCDDMDDSQVNSILLSAEKEQVNLLSKEPEIAEEDIKIESEKGEVVDKHEINVPDLSQDSNEEKVLENSVPVVVTEIDDTNPFGTEVSIESVVEENVTPVISPSKKKEKEKIYPDDLNPFGDDEDDEQQPSTAKNSESYPDTLNPFGDDDDDLTPTKKKEYDESKNPFADDDDEEEDDRKPDTSFFSTPSPRKPPVPAVRTSISNSTPTNRPPFKTALSLESLTGSMKGTLKKRKAPKPPHVTDVFQNGTHDSSPSNSLNTSTLSLKVTTPSPKLHKSKRAPPPPSPVMSSRKASVTSDKKEDKDLYNITVQTNTSHTKAPNDEHLEAQSNSWKKKKRPAPPVPIPPRREIKKIPLKKIQSEMNEIEEKQIELEGQGRELEELIRDRDKDEEPTVEEEEYIMQLFELVNQKNALFRRQAELMYIKRSQRLEEQQVELEFQIRCLLTKPASQKAAEDKAREEQLVQQLLDVVDQRNDIIDSIEMDRKREAEEDVSVQEQMEIKNSDLPITAEIKEKSANKKKEKRKEKKKEKKRKAKEANEEAGLENGKKGTLRKKWF